MQELMSEFAKLTESVHSCPCVGIHNELVCVCVCVCIYVCLCLYVCVCVCVFNSNQTERERDSLSYGPKQLSPHPSSFTYDSHWHS